MSSATLTATVSSLLSTELVLGTVFLLTILVGGAIMYLASFKQQQQESNSKSSDDEEESKSSKKSAKKSATKKQATPPAAAPPTPVAVAAKTKKPAEEPAVAKKAAKQAPVPVAAVKGKKADKAPVKSKEVVVEVKANVSESLDADAEAGWITVVDKKQQKKSSLVDSTPITQPKQAAKAEKTATSVVEAAVAQVEEVPVAEEDDWIPANPKTSKKVGLSSCFKRILTLISY